MEWDLRKIVLEVFREEVLPMMQAGKNRFTAEDIHSIYGPDVATVRRMMNRGILEK